MPRVFISHSTKDSCFIEKELLPLLRRHLIETWYSPIDIQSAEQWERSIQMGLEACDWFLVVMSPQSATSRWVGREVHWAMEERHERFIPVLVETCDLREWHIGIRQLQYIDYRSNSQAARRTARKKLLAVWGIDYLRRPAMPKNGRRASGSDGSGVNNSDSSEDMVAEDSSEEGEKVSERSGSVLAQTGRSPIELVIDRDPEQYSPKEQAKLLSAIKALLSVSGDIRVISKRPGSVRLTLDLTSAQAEKLFWAVKAGELAEFDVIDANLVDIQEEPHEDLGSQQRRSSEKTSDTLLRSLIDAGVHFGRRTARFNPKMQPYIYGKRDLIHIIDLRETVRGLLRAYRYLAQVASKGGLILFVGTKWQAKEAIEREAARCHMPYVNERWLAGILTNYHTIRDRINRLEELEALWMPAGEHGDKANLKDYMKTMLNESGKLELGKAPGTAPIRGYSKKIVAQLNRDLIKLTSNLRGIRDMNRLPDAIVVVDPKHENIAVKEARQMGVTITALIDTDGDPDVVDLPIPGNADSIRSIELVLAKLADAIQEGTAQMRAGRESLECPSAPRRSDAS